MSILLWSKTVRSILHCLQALGLSTVPAAPEVVNANSMQIIKNIMNLFIEAPFKMDDHGFYKFFNFKN